MSKNREIGLTIGQSEKKTKVLIHYVEDTDVLTARMLQKGNLVTHFRSRPKGGAFKV